MAAVSSRFASSGNPEILPSVNSLPVWGHEGTASGFRIGDTRIGGHSPRRLNPPARTAMKPAAAPKRRPITLRMAVRLFRRDCLRRQRAVKLCRVPGAPCSATVCHHRPPARAALAQYGHQFGLVAIGRDAVDDFEGASAGSLRYSSAIASSWGLLLIIQSPFAGASSPLGLSHPACGSPPRSSSTGRWPIPAVIPGSPAPSMRSSHALAAELVVAEVALLDTSRPDDAT